VKRVTLPGVEEFRLEPNPETERMLNAHYLLSAKPVASYYADWEPCLLKT